MGGALLRSGNSTRQRTFSFVLQVTPLHPGSLA
jgi:hypothetical protein